MADTRSVLPRHEVQFWNTAGLAALRFVQEERSEGNRVFVPRHARQCQSQPNNDLPRLPRTLRERKTSPSAVSRPGQPGSNRTKERDLLGFAGACPSSRPSSRAPLSALKAPPEDGDFAFIQGHHDPRAHPRETGNVDRVEAFEVWLISPADRISRRLSIGVGRTEVSEELVGFNKAIPRPAGLWRTNEQEHAAEVGPELV